LYPCHLEKTRNAAKEKEREAMRNGLLLSFFLGVPFATTYLNDIAP
jgi:heme/copper-type cytochrome/quinol oxidase subunit 3